MSEEEGEKGGGVVLQVYLCCAMVDKRATSLPGEWATMAASSFARGIERRAISRRCRQLGRPASQEPNPQGVEGN